MVNSCGALIWIINYADNYVSSYRFLAIELQLRNTTSHVAVSRFMYNRVLTILKLDEFNKITFADKLRA